MTHHKNESGGLHIKNRFSSYSLSILFEKMCSKNMILYLVSNEFLTLVLFIEDEYC